MRSWASRLGDAWRAERGEATLELALVLPVLLTILVGIVQFALVSHARLVSSTAVQEGARLAAAEGRTALDGVTRTQNVLRSGLGATGADFTVTAEEGREGVSVLAKGDYPLFIPWVTGRSLPIEARAAVYKEAFRSGP